jgi:hypothetical protein
MNGAAGPRDKPHGGEDIVATRKAGRAAAACGCSVFTNFRTALAVRIKLARCWTNRCHKSNRIDKANWANWAGGIDKKVGVGFADWEFLYNFVW